MHRSVKRLFGGPLATLVRGIRFKATAVRGSAFGAAPFVVPFGISESEAKERFEAWHRASWFSPFNLVESENLKIQPCYFPFWCFESEMCFSYSATVTMQSDSSSQQTRKTQKGTLPKEMFSFEQSQAQIYASFKHRRDFAEAAKLTSIPENVYKLKDRQAHVNGVQLDAPRVRQGMAWELAVRNIRKLKEQQAEQHLRAANNVADIEGLHLDAQVAQ